MCETEKGIANLVKAIEQGIITPSTQKRLDELENTKVELEISLTKEEIQKEFLTKDKILFWFSKWKELDVSDQMHRQKLIDCFVNAIYLYDDRFVLVLNYRSGATTVSFNDRVCSVECVNSAPNNKTAYRLYFSSVGGFLFFCDCSFMFKIYRKMWHSFGTVNSKK